ncbi:MAG: rRNA maturation RNase YbeY, partial [Nitrospirae bacterium]|nr:rRNA maturation RNase YbeY [Nitrospirota bacterium]
IKFRIHRTREIKKFLDKVITDEKKVPGDLKFIFTNDHNILDINRKFLRHDYYTDVISFDYSKGNIVNGEIYISVETLKNNAILYNMGMKEELLRVMIHGILHLCGYRDESKKAKDLMFGRQEKILKEFGKES